MDKISSFTELDPSIFSFEQGQPAVEKPSQKTLDIFARNLLEQNPELKTSILSTMQLLNQERLELPVIHITSVGIKKDEETVTTRFIENIKQNGFRSRHTNVGAFVKRGNKTQRATAQYFIYHPEEFVKSFYLLLQRYAHHGKRTNKEVLGENRDLGEGIPEIIIIEGNVELERGSDYDDHFTLAQGASADQIIDEIDLESYKPYREHLNELLKQFLEKISAYYTRE